jgi:hypothetical protein
MSTTSTKKELVPVEIVKNIQNVSENEKNKSTT